MRIAMLGTRGVPAHYGGFETAVEEIGRRLVTRGHEVTVYCRETADAAPDNYLGMRLVHLPSWKVLRAMGAGTHVLAYDVSFNREVLGEHGGYFAGPTDLPALLHAAELRPGLARERGALHRARAAHRYDWLEVAAGYEQLCKKLEGGQSIRHSADGRRRASADAV
ncbi:glycosyltransferase [Nocardioides sp. cx-169]|uniref:glycosyltransferase n=1 Tax=Nocardioides sp. cx-169 TaxID=2899080 RepID=UPI001E2DD268|nr:glycosyltransferase [Nocardioides sp. cx-169]MCD4536336.1 glycosyltransferase [Nocardioides sp. cx-169]